MAKRNHILLCLKTKNENKNTIMITASCPDLPFSEKTLIPLIRKTSERLITKFVFLTLLYQNTTISSTKAK